MQTRNSGKGVVHIIGAGPQTDHPTVRLSEGGDVNTYDAETVAAVLDAHTDHLRQLEARVQRLDERVSYHQTVIEAGLRAARLPLWVQLWRALRYGAGWWL